MKVMRLSKLLFVILFLTMQSTFACWTSYMAHKCGYYAGKVGGRFLGYPCALLGGAAGLFMDGGNYVWKGARTTVVYLEDCVFPKDPSKLREFGQLLLRLAKDKRTYYVLGSVVIAVVVIVGGKKVLHWYHERAHRAEHERDIATAIAERPLGEPDMIGEEEGELHPPAEAAMPAGERAADAAVDALTAAEEDDVLLAPRPAKPANKQEHE
jgi:hypothetical protein